MAIRRCQESPGRPKQGRDQHSHRVTIASRSNLNRQRGTGNGVGRSALDPPEVRPITDDRPLPKPHPGPQTNFVATIAAATEIDGKRCALNDWGSRSRKTTMRLMVAFRLVPGEARLSGRGEIVNRETGATARAGVASIEATTAGSEFIRQALTGRPQRASNGNLMRAQARCSETTRKS